MKRLRVENIKQIDALKKQYLGEVFEKLGKKYNSKNLFDITAIITKGSSPNWQGVNYVEKDGILFITSENVRNYYINLEPKKYVEKHLAEMFFDIHVQTGKSFIEIGESIINIVKGEETNQNGLMYLNNNLIGIKHWDRLKASSIIGGKPIKK